MSTRKWPDIEGLHVIVRDLKNFHEGGGPVPPIVQYRAKIKLDGTNAAVRFRESRVEGYQSRTQDVTPEEDNAGFARWASGVSWPPLSIVGGGVGVLHGEWAGPGIQKGTACQSIPGKKFFIFAIEYSGDEIGDDGNWKDRYLVTEPDEILFLLEGFEHPDIHVLPWHTPPSTVNFADPISVQKFADEVNSLVDSVEECDPYIKSLFGVEGVGEGVVLYPILDGEAGNPREQWRRLAFKAKGEKHRVKKSSVPAQVDPEVLRGTKEFVEAFVTEARCEQGIGVVLKGTPPEMRKTGEFLAWVCKDVEKESRTELEASGLTWKQVSGEVSTAARNWYVTLCKKL